MPEISAHISSGQFIDAFLPNFASTVLGLILGLPLAMWGNRGVARYTDRRNEAENRKRLLGALESLVQSAKVNSRRLLLIRNEIAAQRVPLDTRLDLATWDAVRPIIIQSLGEPALQSRIANHFADLGAVPKLCDSYLNYSVGMGAALGGLEHVSNALQATLLDITSALAADAKSLESILDSVIQSRRESVERGVWVRVMRLASRALPNAHDWIRQWRGPQSPP